MGFKRKSASELSEKLKSMTGAAATSHDDPNEWKLTTDSMGEGKATIRFLPSKSDSATPFVKIYNHGFQAKPSNRWYIENCPTTIGLECPVCDANRELWNTGIKSNQNIVRDRKRKLSFWANIVVINDESNPSNNGKVFKYRFGQKIMDKIIAQSVGDSDLGVAGVDVTCVFGGANFVLRSKKVAGYINYDDSKFGPSVELFNGDESELGRVWNEMHDLQEIISPKQFKPKGELAAKLANITGNTANGVGQSASDKAFNSEERPKKPVIQEPASTPSSVSDDLDALLADLDLDV